MTDECISPLRRTIRSEQMHITPLETILAVTLVAAGVWAGLSHDGASYIG